MDQDTVYEGYIEHNAAGTFLAFLADLPGCVARAGSESASTAALTAAIPGYFDWLRAHDEYTPVVHGPFRVTPVSSVVVPAGHLGGFYPFDALPVTNDDLDWRLAVLEWTFDDLAHLSRTGDALANNGASIGDVLRAVVRTHLWLLSRLDGHPPAVSTEELTNAPAEQLRQIARAGVARLRRASDEERQSVYERDGERWSLRKVLRCAVLNARGALTALEG
jgi:predicted RNase H-like HicB family nuclease